MRQPYRSQFNHLKPSVQEVTDGAEAPAPGTQMVLATKTDEDYPELSDNQKREAYAMYMARVDGVGPIHD